MIAVANITARMLPTRDETSNRVAAPELSFAIILELLLNCESCLITSGPAITKVVTRLPISEMMKPAKAAVKIVGLGGTNIKNAKSAKVLPIAYLKADLNMRARLRGLLIA